MFATQQQLKLWQTLCLATFVFCGLAHAKGAHKVHCSEDQMRVDIGLPVEASGDAVTAGDRPQIYLEGLKGYPDVRCQPEINGALAVFRLSLSDFYECGVTRMVNQLTGKKVYYHKVIIESASSKEIVSVKCITTSGPVYNVMMNGTNAEREQTRVVLQEQQQQQQHHGLVRRDVLPAGFQEPEDLEITTSLTKRAPEPRLSIGVSQDGQKFTRDLTVKSGTPLTMEINLDEDSAPVYGLGVNYLDVTDTHTSSETLIFKGCTVDPYLFENFNTIDGDILSAKFKAFKFPDSSYVQFRATVNVCLDKCLGTQCSNNQVGYGRRKREISAANKVYEISLAMFLQVNDIEGVNKNEVLQLEEKLRELKLANQRLARNSRGNFAELSRSMEQTPASSVVPAFVVDERELGQLSSGAINLVLGSLWAVLISALCWRLM
ncbi:uncharacterized protein LOC6559331 [Drosophila grimshawi]|uniref:GH22115 n=1 Tax=Drosophila grimshawi TaxID=7222 RepID=B4J468_DROGR|nr:uncharacterized protein LOC6559331 [Drosophila grimshawi]XP_032590712.1 uncharacterized protein LOC6559331 [Drosophila grimshawi]XP_032590713.1 uncharacterized protein LOC6559331 [Drosophila grimshawi]EDW02674.1 GH22115 [Drosophila grimshawi]